MSGYLKFRDEIDRATVEEQSVLRIDDVKGREYMWDGTELYRLIPLKGKVDTSWADGSMVMR